MDFVLIDFSFLFRNVLEVVASLKGMEEGELANIIFKNSERLFSSS